MVYRSFVIVLAFVAIATAQTDFVYSVIMSYNDAQCNTPSGGFLILSYETLGDCPSVPDCTQDKSRGFYYKVECTPDLPTIPEGYASAIVSQLDNCTATTARPFLYQVIDLRIVDQIGQPNKCFLASSYGVWKFDECPQDTKLTYFLYDTNATCGFPNQESYTATGGSNECVEGTKFLCPVYQSGSPTGSAQPTTPSDQPNGSGSTPQTTSTPSQTPAKKSSNISRLAMNLSMLIGAAVIAVAF